MAGLAHIVPALLSKKYVPRVSTWILILASELIEIFSIVFIIIGIEETEFAISLSHNLIFTIILSIIASIIAAVITKDKKITIIIGLLVLQHWVIDFITHPMTIIFPNDKGIPIFFNGPIIGLGLESTILGMILFEGISLTIGILFYIKTMKDLKSSSKNGLEKNVEEV